MKSTFVHRKIDKNKNRINTTNKYSHNNSTELINSQPLVTQFPHIKHRIPFLKRYYILLSTSIQHQNYN